MASIICGNCKNVHYSVAEVRSCYTVKTAPPVMALHTIRGDVDVPVLDTTPVNVEPRPAAVETVESDMATEKQIEFIKKLGEDRDASKLAGKNIRYNGVVIGADALYGQIVAEKSLPKKAASKLIDVMLDLPYSPKPVENLEKFESVPDGRYAIDNASGKGDTVFYKVYTRRNGSRGIVLQVSDTDVPVRSSDIAGIMKRIGADVEGAFARYGLEIGACGVCGRTLTNEESRHRGIGPVCAEKMGF